MANYEVSRFRAARDLVQWSMDLEEEDGDRRRRRVRGLLFWAAVAQKQREWDCVAAWSDGRIDR